MVLKGHRDVLIGSAIALLLLVYWTWLFFGSHMVVIFDSVGYLQSGELIAQKGLNEYVRQGPAREPLYPLLIALSNVIAKSFSLSLQDVLKFFQLAILGVSLGLFRVLALRCGLSNLVAWCLVIYMGISPAIINSALSIYSEIAVYPFVLLAVLFYWKSLTSSNDKSAVSWAIAAGLASVGLILVKAVFELGIPIFLILCLFVRKGSFWKRAFPLLVAWAVFFAGVNAYKEYNALLNGQYALTNRASWALYGSTKRRTEPLTLRSWEAGVSFVAGRGACERLFGKEECLYWSFEKSDSFAIIERGRLNGLGLSPKETEQAFLTGSLEMVKKAPVQYVFFTILEGCKLFFWESTNVGFVDYPLALSKIYSAHFFNDGLRTIIFLLSWIGFVVLALRLLRGRIVARESAMICIFFFISVAVAYSPFLILTRYALPTAPILLIMIGMLFSRKNTEMVSQ